MADLVDRKNQQPEADEMLGLLAAKRTNLSAPGTKLSSLYYSVANCTADAVEITFNTGRFTSSLSTPFFGAQSQVILANSSFVGTTYLHLELPNIYDGQTLSRGWGYACIQQLSFLFGSSNVSQLQINGQTLWQTVAMQCPTSELRSELFRLGGEELLAPIQRIGAGGIAERDPDAVLTADIILPLPWSSVSALKKSFDTNLLVNPITIQVAFNQANSIYGGSISPNPFPAKFNQAEMMFRQGDLFSKSMSLKRTLMEQPDQSMFYPWIYTQSYLPSAFFGSNDPSRPLTIPLLGFINADLVGVTIGVVRTSLLAPSVGAAPNAFQYDNIQNVLLTFNGTTMFNAPKQSWKLYTTLSGMGAQYFHNSLIQATGVPGEFASVPQDAYLLHIDFASLRSMVYDTHMNNVWRIGNNVMTISFTTEGDSNVRYQMFCSYHYNSVVQVSQGQTQIYFD